MAYRVYSFMFVHILHSLQTHLRRPAMDIRNAVPFCHFDLQVQVVFAQMIASVLPLGCLDIYIFGVRVFRSFFYYFVSQRIIISHGIR